MASLIIISVKHPLKDNLFITPKINEGVGWGEKKVFTIIGVD